MGETPFDRCASPSSNVSGINSESPSGEFAHRKFLGVEAEDSACYYLARQHGKPTDLDEVGLFADGIAVQTIGDITFEVMERERNQITKLRITPLTRRKTRPATQ